jgi:hypothetical protein
MQAFALFSQGRYLRGGARGSETKRSMEGRLQACGVGFSSFIIYTLRRHVYNSFVGALAL